MTTTTDTELTGPQYDLADRIEASALEWFPARQWTPAEIAERVKSTPEEADIVLIWMAAHHYATAVDVAGTVHYTHREPWTPLPPH